MVFGVFLVSITTFADDGVLQELEFNWRVVLATVIGFLGSACGTVGGVGGGGIFVPMLTLLLGFDTKSAAAISKCKHPFSLHFIYSRTRKERVIRYLCR